MFYAATYKSSNGRSWVRNTENWHQLSYFGETYAQKGNRMAQITYYRSGKYIAGAYAYVDSWRNVTSDYDSVTVWDSLNSWAPKTTFYYSL
ncbi:hypothetical protein CBF27_04555 [Vagococcus acidifermentans]|uniref:Uncharacterized protein n=2 Tax=Vagococcus acidifermentans TaxID=564710 RepID=A0A430AZF2_9ENTE|nr:hypothetical protein CBF27_04555 [Vagococcus acidifermentans]